MTDADTELVLEFSFSVLPHTTLFLPWFEIVVVPVGNYTVQIIKIWVGFGSCLFQSKFDDVKS